MNDFNPESVLVSRIPLVLDYDYGQVVGEVALRAELLHDFCLVPITTQDRIVAFSAVPRRKPKQPKGEAVGKQMQPPDSLASVGAEAVQAEAEQENPWRDLNRERKARKLAVAMHNMGLTRYVVEQGLRVTRQEFRTHFRAEMAVAAGTRPPSDLSWDLALDILGSLDAHVYERTGVAEP